MHPKQNGMFIDFTHDKMAFTESAIVGGRRLKFNSYTYLDTLFDSQLKWDATHGIAGRDRIHLIKTLHSLSVSSVILN